jgi:hypothetical protein
MNRRGARSEAEEEETTAVEEATAVEIDEAAIDKEDTKQLPTFE